eukprot:15455123-Alexandrium_andersonii.AAC.1
MPSSSASRILAGRHAPAAASRSVATAGSMATARKPAARLRRSRRSAAAEGRGRPAPSRPWGAGEAHCARHHTGAGAGERGEEGGHRPSTKRQRQLCPRPRALGSSPGLEPGLLKVGERKRRAYLLGPARRCRRVGLCKHT